MSFRIRGLPADHFNRLFELSDEELTPDNFVNIKCITSFVEEKLRQTPVNPI